VWYLLKVDLLIAVFVFAGAGVVIAGLFVWEQARAIVAAHRFFANRFAISRSLSRISPTVRVFSHKSQ
jgi:hypothetical protein